MDMGAKCDKCGSNNAKHSLALCFHDGQPLTVWHRCDNCKPLGYKQGLNYINGNTQRPYLWQENWIEPVEFGSVSRCGRIIEADIVSHMNTRCDICNTDVFDGSVTWSEDGNTILCPSCINTKPFHCDYCGQETYKVYGEHKDDHGGLYCPDCEGKHRKWRYADYEHTFWASKEV